MAHAGLSHAPMKTAAAFPTLVLFGSTLLLSAADWPNFRGPDYNGISKETGWSSTWPAEGPKQLWKGKVGTGFASIAISGDRAYTMGNANETDTVFCFDAATGKELWKHSYPAKLDPNVYEGGPNATPMVAGGRVYTLSKQGAVHCLDAAKGTVIWSTNLMQGLKAGMPTWGFSGSAFITGDLCILNVGTTGVALDKGTGKVVWYSGTDKSGYTTPVPLKVGSDSAVVMAVKAEVVAVRVADGKELWRFPWKTQYDVNAADAVLAGDKLFISSGYNHGGGVFDISARPPSRVWENKNMRNHFNSCVLWQGHLYGVDESQLRCLDLAAGEVKWSDRVSGKGSLILADGKLIVLSEKGELLVAAASPQEFKPISRAQVLGGRCWTAPTLANGRIYCRNAVGDVVCLDVSGKGT